MKLFASALAVSAGFASLLPLTASRSVHSSHEDTGRSHVKRSHDLQKRSFNGQATYFAVGLGACGGYSKPSDFIVAVNTPQYAGGSHCGQTLTITGQGKTQTATVADECPSCAFGSLDMSEGLFSAFADPSVGEFPITWNWGSGDNTQQTSTSTKPKPTTTSTTAEPTTTSTTHTTTSTTSTTSSVQSTTSMTPSSSLSSVSNTSTTSASAPTDTTSDPQTGDQTTQSTGNGSNIANQQKLVYILGNMASFGKSQSS